MTPTRFGGFEERLALRYEPRPSPEASPGAGARGARIGTLARDGTPYSGAPSPAALPSS